MAEVKQKRSYTKHLKEQRELEEYILCDMYSLMLSNYDRVYSIFSKFVDEYISKDDWMFLRDIAEKLTEMIPENRKLGAYEIEQLKSVKYMDRSKHSTYYFVRTKEHVKYLLNNLDTSGRFSSDPKQNKEFSMKCACYYRALSHLWFFVVAPEKI